MNDEESLFDMLQDPLTTLLALILFGTLWIIVPGGGSTEDEGIPPLELRRQLRELEQMIAAYEEEYWLLLAKQARVEGKEPSLAQSEEDQLSSTVKDLEERVNALRSAFATRLNYLKMLEKEREDGIERAAKLKMALLRSSEKNKELMGEINLERPQVEELTKRKKELLAFLAHRKGVLPTYVEAPARDKIPILVEADGGQLHILSDRDYRIESRGALTQWIRRGSATGEPLWKIEQAESDFQKVLNNAVPQENYVYFYVRKDSFAIFLSARLIAERRGFRVGWAPQEAGPVSFFVERGYGQPPRVR